jgi:hypothetical protein
MRMGNSSDDASEVAILRMTLDELFTDRRFIARRSMSASQVADYVLNLVQKGEHDRDRLRALTLEKVSSAPPDCFASNDLSRPEKTRP